MTRKPRRYKAKGQKLGFEFLKYALRGLLGTIISAMFFGGVVFLLLLFAIGFFLNIVFDLDVSLSRPFIGILLIFSLSATLIYCLKSWWEDLFSWHALKAQGKR